MAMYKIDRKTATTAPEKPRRTRQNQRGITLIEIALALLILGLIMTPLLALYNIEHKKMLWNFDDGRLSHLEDILQTYAKNNDRFPRPASLLTREGDANWGVEGVTPDVCPAIGPNGFCRVGAPGAGILIGGIPFDELKIEAEMALDSRKNKILYAVTEVQTDTATFNLNGGPGLIQIEGIDPATGAPVALAETDYDIFLVATGATGKGGYTAEGILVEPCIGMTPENEDQNCNFTDTFLSEVNLDDTLTGANAFVENIQEFFDDQTKAIKKPVGDTWDENENDRDYVVTSINRVGINNPAPVHTLDVRGQVRIDGQLMSDQICRDSDCFDPETVAGAVNDMDCRDKGISGREPVIGVGLSQVYCGSTIDKNDAPLIPQVDQNGNSTGSFKLQGSGISNTDCGAGMRMIAITGGIPQCAP